MLSSFNYLIRPSSVVSLAKFFRTTAFTLSAQGLPVLAVAGSAISAFAPVAPVLICFCCCFIVYYRCPHDSIFQITNEPSL